MAEAAQTEFWRDLKPIEKVFQHALAAGDVHAEHRDRRRALLRAAQRDGRHRGRCGSRSRQNSWCDVLMATGAGLVNRHYHPHEVFAYTISGKWGYLEHDWVATAGDFVYETPGEAHTLVAYESDEPMKVHFKVKGPLIWLDENGDAGGLLRRPRLHRHLQGALREGRPRGRLHRHAAALSRARARPRPPRPVRPPPDATDHRLARGGHAPRPRPPRHRPRPRPAARPRHRCSPSATSARSSPRASTRCGSTTSSPTASSRSSSFRRPSAPRPPSASAARSTARARVRLVPAPAARDAAGPVRDRRPDRLQHHGQPGRRARAQRPRGGGPVHAPPLRQRDRARPAPRARAVPPQRLGRLPR